MLRSQTKTKLESVTDTTTSSNGEEKIMKSVAASTLESKKEESADDKNDDGSEVINDNKHQKQIRIILRLVYAFTFFLAPVKDGLAPLVSVFLVVAKGWTPGKAGLIWFIRDMCSIVANPFVGAVVDTTIRKRFLLIVVTAITTLTACMIIWTQNFAILCVKSVIEGITTTFIQPLKISLVLGLLGTTTFSDESTKVEMFDHSGSFIVIIVSGFLAYLSYPNVDIVFYVIGVGGMIACICLLFMPLYVNDDEQEKVEEDSNKDDGQENGADTRNSSVDDKRKAFAASKRSSPTKGKPTSSSYRPRVALALGPIINDDDYHEKNGDEENDEMDNDTDDDGNDEDDDTLDDESDTNPHFVRRSTRLIKQASLRLFLGDAFEDSDDNDDGTNTSASSRSLINHDSSRNLAEGGTPTSYITMLQNKDFVLYGLSVFFFHLGNAAILPLMSQMMAIDSGVRAGIPYTCANIAIAQLTSVAAAWAMGKAISDHSVKHKIPVLIGYIFAVPIRCALIVLIGLYWPKDRYQIYALMSTQLLDGIGAGTFGLSIPLILEVLTQGTGHFSFSNGIINTLHQCGGALSNLIIGYVVTYTSYNTGFITCGGLGSLSIVLISFVNVTNHNISLAPRYLLTMTDEQILEAGGTSKDDVISIDGSLASSFSSDDRKKKIKTKHDDDEKLLKLENGLAGSSSSSSDNDDKLQL